MDLRQLARPLLAALALVLATVAVTVTVDTGPDQKTHVHVVVQKRAPQAPLGDLQTEGTLHEHADAPPVVARDQALGEQLLEPRPAAGAQSYSCAHLYGGHLWSDRPPGVKATEFVVHYTAGAGTAESTDAYFRSTRAGSATYLLEPSGHCRQELPEGEKPWTQLNANPTSISVEIVTTGYNVSRAQWLAMPIFKHHILADLMRDSMRRNGIPLRHVDPVGCNFIPGWTDHNALECGNDHVDVTPSFPYDVLQRQLVEQDKIDALYIRVRRSHRIVHAKIAKRCRGRARKSAGCQALFKRNGELHARYPKVLAAK